MCQAVCERAVVRHEQQSLAVEIQPPDVIQPLGDLAKIVLHRAPSLRIGGSRDHAARLIQQDHGTPLFLLNRLAVELHAILLRLDRAAERRRFSVDRDAALPDHFLAGAS